MKEEYEKFKLEILMFSDKEDVITTSNAGAWNDFNADFGDEWDGDTTTVPDFW